MRLVVTRPIEDAEPLKARLEARGHRVVLSPLLEIEPLPNVTIPGKPYQLIALTSANGARSLSQHPKRPLLKKKPVLAVGPQTAEAAREAGFADVRMEGGDALALAAHIGQRFDPGAGPILYVSGRDSASDFKGMLETAGFTVVRIIAYEARAVPRMNREVHAGADGVLLFSPRTARIWSELIVSEALTKLAEAMIHFCISANAAAALPEIYAKRIAAKPTEAAMLDLISREGKG